MMTLESARVVESILVGHREIKRKNPDYPKLPKSVREGNEIFNMDEETMQHFESCYAGFEKRVHNWNETREKIVPTTRYQPHPR